MAIRKNANNLNSNERAEFVSAVKTIKSAGIYDQFVLRHANAIMSAIHRCPAFLPWHRRFIWDFEQELQRVSGNPNLGLPYWNWPEGGANASMWDANLLGGNGDTGTRIVSNGPFRSGEWMIVDSSGVQAGPLRRAFGQESWATSLPTQQEIDQVLAIIPYDVSPWNTNSNPSFRNEIEGFRGPNLHNRGHGWVGGSMLPMTSPNDPVFFMHHCMVDKMWHEWQLRFPNQSYLPMNGGAFGQNLNDAMNNTPSAPIGPRPIDVLNSTVLGIEYDQLMAGTPGPVQPTPVPGNTGDVLTINGDSVSGNISNPGEVDIFHFDITSVGEYIIETSGLSDTVITLYGPNDANQEITSDDDGGQNFNSRIAMTLASGTYFVRVRLFSPNTTGSYAIKVSSAGAVDIPQLNVGGQPFNAAISAQNESDLYRFNIVNQATYTVKTEGSTDTFLTLYGPGSQTLEVATDDDSGVGRNSQIRMDLSPGEYFARIRHFSRFGTGSYSIMVQSG